jgi:hypothetical protein
MATIDILPLSIDGVRPPLNLLYELFSGKINTQNLMYPLDLATNPNYGHAVQFTAFDYEYPLASAVGNVFNADNLTDALGRLGNLAADPQTFNPMGLRPRKTAPLATISLYMPDTLAFDYNHNYGEISLTETLGGAALLGSAIADVGAKMQGKDDSNGNYTQLLAKGASLYGVSKFAGQDIAGVLGNAMKTVPNPQLQLLYKGIGLREFQFEFRFTPNSKKEAQSVEEIIKSFTYYSVPRLLGAQSHQYLEPPQIFQIKFAFTGGTGLSGAVSDFFRNIGTNILTSQISGSLFGSNPLNSNTAPTAKIFEIYSDCVLTNMNIDYAPNGWAAHDDGYPVEIRLTLQFKELDIVTKDNIRPPNTAGFFGGNLGPTNLQDAVRQSFPSFDQMFPNLK